ncbi:DNA polymerase IV [Metasolibacillus meyeri]|uniref:DNA polymerase IV n=1 Tax=Metasolibacillus meyeri TaxID=1071052 RepID=A0AAW9NLF9_9BACL|nr:DNA polymerase IV [Metasolibacillus meyeri]MEC1178192.1 DNA polymerase IV [Metasolibacillus meyeri]
MASRVIVHIDMNCFYASVEQVFDVSLKGKPIAIAGNPKERRGIIITCSYEARAFGVKTTMTVYEAKKLCPELLILPPDFERYRHASKQFFKLLREYTELVEPVSIDESYMDISELSTKRHAMEIVEEIQQRIYTELQLPCSLGVAPNKFLAKTASDMKKPMGITVLRKRDVPEKLWPLPVIAMHGVGKKTANKLATIGVTTIEQLAKVESHKVRQLLGINGERLKAKANGEDRREVDPNSIYDTKSVGNSTTLPRDETDYEALQLIIQKLSAKVAERLKAKRLAGTTVTVYIRDADWHNQTRSKSLKNAIAGEAEIFEIAWSLFTKHWDEAPVRLLGVTVSNVTDQQHITQQLGLFDYEEQIKDEPIVELMQQLERKFGKEVIKRGIAAPTQGKYQANTSFSKDFLDDLKE